VVIINRVATYADTGNETAFGVAANFITIAEFPNPDTANAAIHHRKNTQHKNNFPRSGLPNSRYHFPLRGRRSDLQLKHFPLIHTY
jgi:hypothetical protein